MEGSPSHTTKANHAALFQPLSIGKLKLSNRIAVSPICTYAANAHHEATHIHREHYRHLASQHPGLVMIESTSIAPLAYITPTDLGLSTDAQADAFKLVIDEIHACGVKCCLQLSHPGAKSMPGGVFPFDPDAMSDAMITGVVRDFVSAAKRGVDVCHADFIEVACCNGNLLHSFLSLVTNHRRDKYGMVNGTKDGSLLLIEVIQAIKKEVAVPIFVKLAVCDNLKPDESLEHTAGLCQQLAMLADLIDVTSGGLNADSKSRYLLNHDRSIPGQVPLAIYVKKLVGDKCAVGCSGGLDRDIQQLNQFISRGDFDIAFIGKGFTETHQKNLMDSIAAALS
ncbi:uncharacterized protein LODBEIA_P02040 [Lodderomyces beijingensis]|uniref:NADH:flavin oxidoreductase/NADH oxidase N-terminal domain-containing protein n=1 Tax=Lodderomyces beijingensis TaxID=1775926 RepID=A0ABP0ZCS3_9ASCO